MAALAGPVMNTILEDAMRLSIVSSSKAIHLDPLLVVLVAFVLVIVAIELRVVVVLPPICRCRVFKLNT